MIADLAQLHQDVDDAHEVAGRKCLLCSGQHHHITILASYTLPALHQSALLV